MLFKNVASQKIHVYAYDSTTGAAKTGDAANITAYVSLDGTANAIDDTNPAEVDATNMPGVYVFDLAQAETNCNSFALYAKSSTANIRIEPIIGFTTGAAVTQTGDTYALAAGATGFMAIDTVVDAIKAKTDSLTFTVAGDLDANVQSWAGASVATPSVAGVPEVDLTHVGGTAASGVATVDANVTTIEAGAITAAAIATGAIDADALAADAGTEIGAAVKTAIEAAGSHLTLIKTKTDYLPSATAGAAGGVFIAGTNAPVTITGSGHALTLTSTGANGRGVSILAHGSGSGVHIQTDTGSGVDVYAPNGGTGVNIAADGNTGVDIYGLIDGLEIDGGTQDIDANLRWNAAWDAEVQSECTDALTAWGKTGFSLLATTGLGNQTANITGTVSGNSTHSAADVVTALEANGSKLDVLYDDWINGGRLDLLLDAVKAKTDNLPSDPADQSAVEAAITAVQSHGDTTWATATSVTVSDKTGFKLASDGLDSVAVTAPTGPAANFREMLVQTWRRFFKKSTLTATQLKTYADDGNTVITTQTVSDVAGNETQGPAT